MNIITVAHTYNKNHESFMQITVVWEIMFNLPLELTTEETEEQKYPHVSEDLRCCES